MNTMPTRFIDVVKNISEYLDADPIEQIVSVYADKGMILKQLETI